MTLSAENFTRKPVTKLVQNLREKQRHAQEQQVARPEELLKLREFRAEMIELNSDEKKRREHKKEASPEDDRMKHPANPRQQLVEESVRIDAFKSNREDIGTRAENLLTTTLLATF